MCNSIFKNDLWFFSPQYVIAYVNATGETKAWNEIDIIIFSLLFKGFKTQIILIN